MFYLCQLWSTKMSIKTTGSWKETTLTWELKMDLGYWSCRSVYRRQDVCVAKVILWILSSCTYWWENRYPLSPIATWWYHPHSWLMTPLPILGWWPPYPYLADDPPPYLADGPPPIVGWWPPYPYLADDPPTHTWLMTPPYLADAPPHSWLMTPPTHTCLMPPPPWLDDVLSQVGFSSVCVKAGPHETCAAGTSFHFPVERSKVQQIESDFCSHFPKNGIKSILLKAPQTSLILPFLLLCKHHYFTLFSLHPSTIYLSQLK